jgi:hemoglobin-like flavoprotein
MTEHQIALVQRSWERVLPIADTAAALFYGRLFELDPALRPMFRGDLAQQGTKLMQMITTVVRSLDRLERVLGAIEALGRRHAGYGVRDEHYVTVGAALLWTLEQGLGDAWDAELADAWATAYGTLAGAMQAAAARSAAA